MPSAVECDLASPAANWKWIASADLGCNRRMLTNLSCRAESCPITSRTKVIPCGYTDVGRSHFETPTKVGRGKKINWEQRVELPTPAFLGLRSLGLTVFSINNLTCQSGNYCDHSVTSADVRLSVGVQTFRKKEEANIRPVRK
jgi:hypothetical protein